MPRRMSQIPEMTHQTAATLIGFRPFVLVPETRQDDRGMSSRQLSQIPEMAEWETTTHVQESLR
jgi:hypothetical protein